MKILCFIDSLGSGGAQRQLVNLAIGFKEKGHDVSFLVYHSISFFKQPLDEHSIPVHEIIESNYLKRLFTMRRFIRSGNFDAVLSFLDVPNFLNNVAAIGRRKWKVITGERSAKEEFLKSKTGKTFAWFQRYSDYIVCNSKNAENMWRKYYPKYSHKLKTIYNTVTLTEISSNYIPRKDGKTNIVVAASYQYLKNPIGVIKALSLMSEGERSKVHVDWYGRIEVVYGNTMAYEESMRLIKTNGLEDTICLNDATKDIINKMNEADVVALFSSVEGLPNTICEGMMIGKPIIMSRVSDYDVLVDDKNGYLCDWDNPVSIKDAIIDVSNLGEDELLEKGKQSKAKAERLFSNETILKNWANLIAK